MDGWMVVESLQKTAFLSVLPCLSAELFFCDSSVLNRCQTWEKTMSILCLQGITLESLSVNSEKSLIIIRV